MEPPAPTIRVGFTGTQAGMNLAQKVQIAQYLDLLDKDKHYKFHHGCCIGADEEFHRLVRSSLLNARLIGHPSNIFNKTSGYCIGDCDLLHDESEPLKRNHIIVEIVDELLAAPKTNHETLRSGTWATMRYAYKKPIPTVEFYPDGIVLRFEN